MTAKELLQKALLVFGPNGENWTKGVVTDKECSLTALNAALGPDQKLNKEHMAAKDGAVVALRAALPAEFRGLVSQFNDDLAITFPDVQNLYNKAIQSLEG